VKVIIKVLLSSSCHQLKVAQTSFVGLWHLKGHGFLYVETKGDGKLKSAP